MIQATYDSIVIGAGSAGMAFATTAADLGARVLLVERATLGGTCVNRGCVPKKIMWTAGQIARTTAQAAASGIATRSDIDFATLTAKRDAHIADLRDNFADTLQKAGVDLIKGTAKVTQDRTVIVDDQSFQAAQIILATGGRPTEMSFDGADLLAYSNGVLSWTSRPDRMVIIGGGYIGCEFAAIFNALGAQVTLVHDGPNILDTFPEPMARHVQDGLRDAGITVLTDDAVAQVAQQGDHRAYWCKSGKTGRADAIVAAIGRTPNIDTLGPIADLLDVADSGALAISDRFETNIAGLYAIGDLADRLPLTPVATADGTALAHMLHGKGAQRIDLNLVATTTFVYPPAAHVGIFADGPARQDRVTPLEQNVLAQMQRAPDYYRLGFDQNNALTGASIAGDGAQDMIALFAALMAAGAKTDVLAQATAVHPSFAEEFFQDTQT